MKFIDVGYICPPAPDEPDTLRYHAPAQLELTADEAEIAHWIVAAAHGEYNLIARELKAQLQQTERPAVIRFGGDFALQIYGRIVDAAKDDLRNSCLRRAKVPSGMSLVARQLLAAAEYEVATPVEIERPDSLYDLALLQKELEYTAECARAAGSRNRSNWSQPTAAGAGV